QEAAGVVVQPQQALYPPEQSRVAAAGFGKIGLLLGRVVPFQGGDEEVAFAHDAASWKPRASRQPLAVHSLTESRRRPTFLARRAGISRRRLPTRPAARHGRRPTSVRPCAARSPKSPPLEGCSGRRSNATSPTLPPGDPRRSTAPAPRGGPAGRRIRRRR